METNLRIYLMSITPIIIWILWMYIDQEIFFNQKEIYLYESWAEPLFIGIILIVQSFFFSLHYKLLKLGSAIIISGFVVTAIFGLPLTGLPRWVFYFPTFIGFPVAWIVSLNLSLSPFMDSLDFNKNEKFLFFLGCIPLLISTAIGSYYRQIMVAFKFWASILHIFWALILLVFFILALRHKYPFKAYIEWLLQIFLLVWIILFGMILPPNQLNLEAWKQIFPIFGGTFLFGRDRGTILFWFSVFYAISTFLYSRRNHPEAMGFK